MTVVEILLEPFTYAFMRNALLIASFIAIPTALLSCFLVLKGWSLMGDAISHAILPGVVLAYIVAIPLAVGAFLAGMLCAIATGFLHEHSRVKQDTVMGVVFSGMFGLGIVMYTQVRTGVHLDHILYGDIQGVGPADLLESGIIALVVGGIVAIKWRDMLLHAFDPAQAQTIGLPVRLLHYGLLAMLSLTIVGTLKASGLILAIALVIAPGAIAFLMTRRFESMLRIALAVAFLCSVGGVYASFFLDSAPAPTIVLLMTVVFIIVFLVQSIRARQSTASVGNSGEIP